MRTDPLLTLHATPPCDRRQSLPWPTSGRLKGASRAATSRVNVGASSMSAGQNSGHQHASGYPRRGQFVGCLLGQAVGDGLGAPYEGLLDDIIFRMGPADAIVRDPHERVLRYTDDTQMAIGVAESL